MNKIFVRLGAYLIDVGHIEAIMPRAGDTSAVVTTSGRIYEIFSRSADEVIEDIATAVREVEEAEGGISWSRRD